MGACHWTVEHFMFRCMNLFKHENWYLPTYLYEASNNHNFIIVCAVKLPEPLNHFCIALFSYILLIFTSISFRYKLISHGVSIIDHKFRRSTPLSKTPMVMENYSGWNEMLCSAPTTILEAKCLFSSLVLPFSDWTLGWSCLETLPNLPKWASLFLLQGLEIRLCKTSLVIDSEVLATTLCDPAHVLTNLWVIW